MITDRIRSIINESRDLELIMENLGALRAYSQPMVKQLLTYRKDIGPGSKMTVKTFKNAAAAERAVKENSRMTFALVPPGEPAIAILTPQSGGYGKTSYHVIKNPDVRFPVSGSDALAKVGDYLYRGTVSDVYGLFNTLNKAYGKNWELHEIQIDSDRVELRQARAAAKEGVRQFDNRRQGRAPYGNWDKKALMDRLDAYKTGKSPVVKSKADILKLLTSSGAKLPVKFKLNGLNFDLSNSRLSINEKSGVAYRGLGDLFGLEYRADWNEYYEALKGVPDADVKSLAETLPKYIEVDYAISNGAFVPSSVTFKA
jgi:hypothetical protein